MLGCCNICMAEADSLCPRTAVETARCLAVNAAALALNSEFRTEEGWHIVFFCRSIAGF